MAYRNVARFNDSKWTALVAMFRLASVPTYTMAEPHPDYVECSRWKKIFRYVGI